MPKRLVIELGMGDGRLLGELAKSDTHALYLGIEIDSELCLSAKSLLPPNAQAVNRKCEQAIEDVGNGCVDEFIAVLPDPSLIDRNRESEWRGFYAQLFAKLKPGGSFRLITELTNDLFEPVPESEYHQWVSWLDSCFSALGFQVSVLVGSPENYTSRCLDQFRGDPDRIKLVTLEMTKH